MRMSSSFLDDAGLDDAGLDDAGLDDAGLDDAGLDDPTTLDDPPCGIWADPPHGSGTDAAHANRGRPRRVDCRVLPGYGSAEGIAYLNFP
jgi:hypothetical protein